MKKGINPMFTSKLQYVLEVFGHPTSQICKDKEEDTIIKKLQVLPNIAMRAALGIGGKERTSCSSLLSLTCQTSVGEMWLRAVSRAAKIHIGMEIEGQELPLAGGRLIWPQRTSMIRNHRSRLAPFWQPWLQSGMGCLKPSNQKKVKQSTRKKLLHSAVTYNKDKFEL
jgi:hypothetical protein